MGIAKIKRAGVDKHAASLFRRNFKSPQNGLGECLLHGSSFVRIVRDRSEIIVGLNQKNLRSDPLELDDTFATQLPAIQADVVRADAGGQ